MKTKILYVCLLCSFWVEASSKQSLFDSVYELTSSDERTLRAKILDFEVDKVSVEAEANKVVYEIPYSRFNQVTQTMLHQLWAKEVNEKLGIDIMPEDSSALWDSDILEFIKKFSTKRKIKIPDSVDYYYLANEEHMVLGARAYKIRVYPNGADDAKVKSIDIEFANVKTYPLGEIQATVFGTSQSSDDLDAAMNKDKEAITAKLNDSFGKGIEGMNENYAFIRWDSKGYSFLLESRALDALLLHIVSTDSLPPLEKDETS